MGRLSRRVLVFRHCREAAVLVSRQVLSRILVERVRDSPCPLTLRRTYGYSAVARAYAWDARAPLVILKPAAGCSMLVSLEQPEDSEPFVNEGLHVGRTNPLTGPIEQQGVVQAFCSQTFVLGIVLENAVSEDVPTCLFIIGLEQVPSRKQDGNRNRCLGDLKYCQSCQAVPRAARRTAATARCPI